MGAHTSVSEHTLLSLTWVAEKAPDGDWHLIGRHPNGNIAFMVPVDGPTGLVDEVTA